ncbi:uncharacterized protein [Watersipora subatra]|uniref:uncharacterized protein n=1 Tax=Watersipora subatra TaxID=2589382 RepID=UPI00355C36B8
MRTCSIIEKLKRHFMRFGIPRYVVTDADRRFLANEFQVFKTKCDFEHSTSSPHHHNANSKAESAVKAAKTVMAKCKEDRSDITTAILDIGNTPKQGYLTSPSQKMFGQRCMTLTPVTEGTLKQWAMEMFLAGIVNN